MCVCIDVCANVCVLTYAYTPGTFTCVIHTRRTQMYALSCIHMQTSYLHIPQYSCIYAHIHTQCPYIHTYIHTYINTQSSSKALFCSAHSYIHTCTIFTHTYIHTQNSSKARSCSAHKAPEEADVVHRRCQHTGMCTYVYARVYTCMYVCVYIYIYIYIT